MFKRRPDVTYIAGNPVCILCKLPMQAGKMHICYSIKDFVKCHNCGARWNPGFYRKDPETCAFCTMVEQDVSP